MASPFRSFARRACQDQFGGVEAGLGGFARNRRLHGGTRAMRVINGPDRVQGNFGFAIEDADAGCVQQRIPQTHSLSAQIGRNLIEDPAPLHRGIVADQPLDFTVKTLFELAVILDPADLVRIAFPDFQRRAAGKRSMRLVVVFAFHPSPQTQIELIDGRDTFQIHPLDELLAKRSPDAFDLSFRRSIPGPAVHQVNPQPCAQQTQVIAREASMVVQSERAADTAPGNRLKGDGQETLLRFAKTAIQIGNQPAAIIEEPKHNHALGSSRRRIPQHRPMQRIGLPEFPARRGLPAISHRMAQLHAGDRQTVPVKQPLYTRHARLAGDHPPRQFQFPLDQMRRAARILPLHIQDQLLEIFGEHPAPVAVRARTRFQSVKAAVTVLVEPLLQRLVSHAAWPSVMILIGLFGELFQLQAQLSPAQIPAEYITQNRMAKQRFVIPFLVGHEFLLVLVHVMEPSMASSAARAQGLPLWAVPSAWRRKANPHRFRDGTASRATPNAGRAPARLGSTSPPRPTHRELWRAIPKPGASRRAIASDVVGLAGGSRPVSGCPVWIPANPTTSATPTTAPATAADCAIAAYRRVRISRRSRVLSPSESSADRALPR